MTGVIPTETGASKYVIVPMWVHGSGAHRRAVHPFQNITLAQYHIADMQATASRHRLARRARRHGAARSPAPAATEPIPMRFLAEPDERRPAA